ncbi:MAG TPA: hypothetical protein VNW90_18200 [Acetobacteraceae bacterium]|jgi:hypothetical protein|nr:hypothetical protein [Acetobacteraceae bacterium]
MDPIGEASSAQPLLERLFDLKDWIIGIVAGLLSGLVASGLFLLLLSTRVPKLTISEKLVLDRSGALRISVINRRRKWLLLKGDSVSNQAELLLVAGNLVRHVPLLVANPMMIRHREFLKNNSSQNEYVFKTHEGDQSVADFAAGRDTKHDRIRFRIYCKDNFSNFDTEHWHEYFPSDIVKG